MFFFKRTPAGAISARDESLHERLIPPCYDEFRGTKIHDIIQHPKADVERIYISVPYTSSSAAKTLGAKWDPEARRWWYWTTCTEHLAFHDDIETYMQVLLEAHERSVFAEWPMDIVFMKNARNSSLEQGDFFDYSNPLSEARRK